LNGACSSKMRVICEERSSISPVYTPKSAWQEWKQRRRSPVRDITDGVVIGGTVGVTMTGGGLKRRLGEICGLPQKFGE
jgi:hypothetical protein